MNYDFFWKKLGPLKDDKSDVDVVEDLLTNSNRNICNFRFASDGIVTEFSTQNLNTIQNFCSILDTPAWYQVRFLERLATLNPEITLLLVPSEVRIFAVASNLIYHSDKPHRNIALNYDLSHSIGRTGQSKVQFKNNPEDLLSYEKNHAYLLNVARVHRVLRDPLDTALRLIVSVTLLRDDDRENELKNKLVSKIVGACGCK